MIDTTTIFGPATVENVRGKRIAVRLPDGVEAQARLAVAFPYSPACGDRVLVIGQDFEEIYVIGVLEGRGKTVFRVPGDLELEAPDGSITLKSGKSVEIEAPYTALRAGRLDIVAGRILEKARNVYSWISGLLQVKSRRIRTTAEDSFHIRGGRTTIKARTRVSIDGREIHLG